VQIFEPDAVGSGQSLYKERAMTEEQEPLSQKEEKETVEKIIEQVTEENQSKENKTEGRETQEARAGSPLPPGGARAPRPQYSTTRALTEGALMALVAALLGLASLFLPGVGLLLYFIWPLPLTLLVLRHGFRYGIMGTVITAILLVLMTGPAQGLLLVVNMAGVGLVFGYCFREKIPAGKTLFIGTLAAAVSGGLTLVLSTVLGDISISQLIAGAESSVDRLLDIYQSAGVLDRFLSASGMTLPEMRESLVNWAKMILPAAFVIFTMVAAMVNYALDKVILKRLGYQFSHLLPFREWRMPWQMIWGVIAGLVALALNRWLDMELLTTIALNMGYIMGPILAVYGLAFVAWMWKRFPTPFSKAIWIFLFIFFFQYSVVFLMLLGLINSIVDLRALYGAEKKR